MSTFLLEIGLEEVPAHLVSSAEEQLMTRTQKFLDEHRLSVGELKRFSTPRRLAVQMIDVASESEALSEEKRGPSVERARDESGNWSKAAQGFARGQGATPDDFEERDGYVWLTKHTAGVSAADILSKIGDEVVSQMKFTTYMKWANHSFLYVRPIRWLVALLDSEVLPFNILDVTTGNTTRGHRFLSTENVVIPDADSYEETLKSAFVIADADVRKQIITTQLQTIANANHWTLSLDDDAAQALLEEVNNIVEYPTAFAGTFDAKYLEVPDEVLITSMREHQRFFYVSDDNGKLLPNFLSVRNGNDQNLDNVIAGNEKVLVARLEDAEFFYREDQQKSIADYMEKVKKLVFHEKIGTVYEHMQRVGSLSQKIAKALRFDDTHQADLARAAEIYKFDLMTGMVGEFDELQGIMGEHYAKLFGENNQVATAIKEHYMPTSATGDVAGSDVGAALAIADKLDTIVTFFGAGLIPSGSNDPYGLRRAATGIVRTLIEKQWHVDLRPLLTDFIAANNAVTQQADINAIVEFILDRVRKISLDNEVRQDIVLAGSSNSQNTDIVYIAERISVLAKHAADNQFKHVIAALTRVSRLAQKEIVDQPVKPELFENATEQALFEATKLLDLAALQSQGAEAVYQAVASLEKPISNYFEATMVNSDDEAVKSNRYAQLHVINTLIDSLGNLEAIVIK